MKKGSDLILVTGATGKQGGAVAHELIAAGHRVRAMTRHTDSPNAKALMKLGVEVVQGDLDDPASLPKALAGAWGTFAVQNTWEAGVEREELQGKRLAEAARNAGVEHYVYASVGSAHRHTGIPHFDNKARIEQKVRELNFPSSVVIRPVFFMENLLSPDNKSAIDDGRITIAIKPTTKLQMIAVADIGKYGKLAFEQADRLAGRAIDIAGDELTMPEVADIVGRLVDHPVVHSPIPTDEVRKFNKDVALTLEWFDAVGYEADIAGNAKEFGIAPTSFTDWARRAFRGHEPDERSTQQRAPIGTGRSPNAERPVTGSD